MDSRAGMHRVVGARKAAVAFIFVTLLLDTLGIGVVVPVLPRLIVELVGGDVAAASRSFGAFAAVYASMQFVFAPILGGLSDKVGRRPVILASLLGASLDYLFLAFAPSLGWLFVGRVISGITGASFSAATAYIADVTPPEKRAQNFGLIGAAFGIGFILGPALGGFMGGISLRAPFIVSAGLNALNAAYGIFVLPESLSPEHRRAFSIRRANPLGALRGLSRSPTVLGLTGTLVCSYLAQQILQTTWALYTEVRYAWRPLDVGLSLSLVGISSGLVQGGLVRLVIGRFGERRAVLAGLLFSLCGFASVAWASRGWQAYFCILPLALGGIAGPALQAILSREVSASEQGELQGSLGSLQSVTAVIAPILATALLARYAPEHAAPHIPGAPFFAAALLHAVGFALALRLFARRQSPPASVASSLGS